MSVRPSGKYHKMEGGALVCGKGTEKKYNVVHDLTTINSVWCQNEEYATF